MPGFAESLFFEGRALRFQTAGLTENIMRTSLEPVRASTFQGIKTAAPVGGSEAAGEL